MCIMFPENKKNFRTENRSYKVPDATGQILTL